MERKLVDARVDLESAAYFRQIVEVPYLRIKPTLGKVCFKKTVTHLLLYTVADV